MRLRSKRETVIIGDREIRCIVYTPDSLRAAIWRLWPRMAARVLEGRSYRLSDSPNKRQKGQPLWHWLRFGRVGASHYLLAENPTWRAVLKDHGRGR